MESSARSKILSRIKEALGREQSSGEFRPDFKAASRADLEKLAQQIKVKCAQQRDNLVDQFEKELTLVRGKLYRCESQSAASDYIRDLTKSRGSNLAVGWNSLTENYAEIIASLKSSDITFIADSGDARGDYFVKTAIDAGIGISEVDYAIAETGTLVVLTGEGRARSASLLPPVHIAIVRPDQFIVGLDDLFPLLRFQTELMESGLFSAVTFITGPSRTADIELTLVVGVHGPQELHVILLDEK